MNGPLRDGDWTDINDPYAGPIRRPHEQVDPIVRDLNERWLPTPTSIRHAVALLQAEPRADLAAIPMYMPNKTHGWWTLGQEVYTVAGVVLIGVNTFDDPMGDVPSFSWARNEAAAVARRVLSDRDGTVGWAVVDRSGHAAVFEDFA
jgi:hypothetical protein